jgi:coenzyme F420-0:L-glutamate ligase/coenzyme F420-1:gamma-L-glutamate ligase
MEPVRDYRGSHDTTGQMLKVTQIAEADELAGAAELVMGKARAVPVAIVRGHKYSEGRGAVATLLRDRSADLFR